MKDNLITLKEYAAMHGVEVSTIRHRIRKGQVKTAVKFGRDWFIDKDEVYVDRRIVDGDSIGWRQKYGKKGTGEAAE